MTASAQAFDQQHQGETNWHKNGFLGDNPDNTGVTVSNADHGQVLAQINSMPPDTPEPAAYPFMQSPLAVLAAPDYPPAGATLLARAFSAGTAASNRSRP